MGLTFKKVSPICFFIMANKKGIYVFRVNKSDNKYPPPKKLIPYFLFKPS